MPGKLPKLSDGQKRAARLVGAGVYIALLLRMLSSVDAAQQSWVRAAALVMAILAMILAVNPAWPFRTTGYAKFFVEEVLSAKLGCKVRLKIAEMPANTLPTGSAGWFPVEALVVDESESVYVVHDVVGVTHWSLQTPVLVFNYDGTLMYAGAVLSELGHGGSTEDTTGVVSFADNSTLRNPLR